MIGCLNSAIHVILQFCALQTFCLTRYELLLDIHCH